MARIALLLILLLIWPRGANAQPPPYGIARVPAPVLNSPDFKRIFGGGDGRSLKIDRCGQVQELEYIALPGTVFRILGTESSGGVAIYRVQTDEYPAPAGVRLYLDSRFVEPRYDEPPPAKRLLPPRERIVAALKGALGNPYVWGGNVSAGVPELAQWFLHADSRGTVQPVLAGLDCSGLLYQATSGVTPRNTSQLVSFGRGVAVEGKDAGQIAVALQPLDLIVWNGHVVIVLDRETAIESRLECGTPGNGGVVTTPLRQRLREITQSRRPRNSWPSDGKRHRAFVVRRWYGP